MAFSTLPTGTWNELDVERRRGQSRAIEEYEHLHETIRILLRAQPPDTLQALDEADTVVREALERRDTFQETVADAREAVRAALSTQIELLERLPDDREGVDLFLADTNAVLYNPDLEKWSFEASDRFELVLTPTITSELDRLKVESRNDDIRERSRGLITRIQGYRQRGDLTSGVPLHKPTSTLRAVGREPRMSETLPWLDPANDDDRLIASAIELARQHPRSAVTIVTRDINLENKAAVARIPYVRPPEPDERPARKPPVPDVRIRDLRATGGSVRVVTFNGTVQNREQHPVHVEFAVEIDGTAVPCDPQRANLLSNTAPTNFRVNVPRPALGDLMKACNNETTLYGRTLELSVTVDGAIAAREQWREPEYDPENNLERHRIQRLYWRQGGGGTTPQEDADLARRELLAGLDERHRPRWDE